MTEILVKSNNNHSKWKASIINAKYRDADFDTLSGQNLDLLMINIMRT